MIEGTVVLDLRPAHPGLSGIGRYALNLCQSLERTSHDLDLLVLAAPSSRAWLREHVRSRILEVSSSGPEWNDLVLPGLLKDVDAVLYHTPLFVLPAIEICAYLATIHDVIPLARPDLTPPAFRSFFADQAPRAVRRATKMVAVSHFSRTDAIRHLKLNPEDVEVIYETVSSHFRPVPLDQAGNVLSRHGLKPGYLLCVGALDRRKNLPLVLDTCLELRARGVHIPDLVFVGGPSGDGFSLEAEVRRRKDLAVKIRLLGRVPDDELPSIYSAARALLFPSLYEGFGLPVLEAMACGTPVIASQATSLPEVAGDAALLFDPGRVDELATAVARLLADDSLHRDLRTRGFAQVSRFSPQAQGQGIVSLYERILSEAA